jgi:hypothetical protein
MIDLITRARPGTTFSAITRVRSGTTIDLIVRAEISDLIVDPDPDTPVNIFTATFEPTF